MVVVEVKCKKCRIILLKGENNQMLDAHGSIFQPNLGNLKSVNCDSLLFKNEIFLKEDTWPEWICKNIELSQWTKGKLKCNCEARIGSFDFVTGNRCSCSEFVLPAVHFVKSKIDLRIIENK